MIYAMKPNGKELVVSRQNDGSLKYQSKNIWEKIASRNTQELKKVVKAQGIKGLLSHKAIAVSLNVGEDVVLKQLANLYWYDKAMLDMYFTFKTVRKVSKETGIPYVSCYKTIKSTLNKMGVCPYKSHIKAIPNLPENFTGKVYGRAEVANMFNVELTTVHGWMKRGLIKASFKMNGRYFFTQQNIDEGIKNMKTQCA